jgi:hypothetical protein
MTFPNVTYLQNNSEIHFEIEVSDDIFVSYFSFQSLSSLSNKSADDLSLILEIFSNVYFLGYFGENFPRSNCKVNILKAK